MADKQVFRVVIAGSQEAIFKELTATDRPLGAIYNSMMHTTGLNPGGRMQMRTLSGKHAMVDGEHANFGPRAGFAWQVSSKLVLRGGYGLFIGERDQAQQVTQFSGNPPNVPTVSMPAVSAGQPTVPGGGPSSPVGSLPVTGSSSGTSAPPTPVHLRVTATAVHSVTVAWELG